MMDVTLGPMRSDHGPFTDAISFTNLIALSVSRFPDLHNRPALIELPCESRFIYVC
ncbi:MAG: hypothetical protein HOH43_28565 [Candidatus Latescibacteria bacterium]|nr:hypothetical protein [Candidatus Latescibacterota bacterium]